MLPIPKSDLQTEFLAMSEDRPTSIYILPTWPFCSFSPASKPWDSFEFQEKEVGSELDDKKLKKAKEPKHARVQV